MKKGEVWLVQLFQTTGSEQQGTRPAIIVADTPTNISVVIPCTSHLKALRFPHTMQVEPSSRNGLATSSVALLFHIRAIDKARLVRKIGDLESKQLQKIKLALRKFLF